MEGALIDIIGWRLFVSKQDWCTATLANSISYLAQQHRMAFVLPSIWSQDDFGT